MVPKKPPTELELVEAIYRLYFETFTDFTSRDDEQRNRYSKNYVPIDLRLVAQHLDADQEIVFGALYYVLNEKHQVKELLWKIAPDGGAVRAPFFLKRWPIDDEMPARYQRERNLVHFPMLATIYASLREEDTKAASALRWSMLSVVVALISLLATCSR